MEDFEILELIRENRSEGLETLFKKYYAFLTRAAYYITNDRETAEDLAQDVFVKFWERRQHLTRIDNLKGYLSIMIKNSALDHLEKGKQAETSIAQYHYLSLETAEKPGSDESEIKALITQALLKLPPRCRLIFSLNRLEGLTNDEIASYLEISKRTVETQMSNALKILRIELKSALDRYLSLLFF